MLEKNNLKNVEIIYVGSNGFKPQYKIKNINLLEQYRKLNVMTKKDMANILNIGLRSYEKITYNENIGTKCAKKLKDFLNYA